MRSGTAMVLVSCLVPVGASGQALFKCTTKEGRTVYQDSKCPEETRQSVVKPPSPPASAPCPTSLFAQGGQQPPEAARDEMSAMVDVLVNYQGCNADVPAFGPRFAGAYRQWRERSREAFARFDALPAAHRMVECRVESEHDSNAAGTAEAKAYRTNICMTIIGPDIERIAREGTLLQKPR